MKSVTPFGSRQFLPPAEHADWGGMGEPSNRSEMSTTEFFEQNFAVGTFEKPGGEAFRRLQAEIERLMQAYAEHLEETAWVSVGDSTPDLIEGKDYSENVFAICEGLPGVQVMCYCCVPVESLENVGYLWANAYGKIDGECELDDDYKVTKWRHIPNPPTP